MEQEMCSYSDRELTVDNLILDLLSQLPPRLHLKMLCGFDHRDSLPRTVRSHRCNPNIGPASSPNTLHLSFVSHSSLPSLVNTAKRERDVLQGHTPCPHLFRTGERLDGEGDVQLLGLGFPHRTQAAAGGALLDTCRASLHARPWLAQQHTLSPLAQRSSSSPPPSTFPCPSSTSTSAEARHLCPNETQSSSQSSIDPPEATITALPSFLSNHHPNASTPPTKPPPSLKSHWTMPPARRIPRLPNRLQTRNDRRSRLRKRVENVKARTLERGLERWILGTRKRLRKHQGCSRRRTRGCRSSDSRTQCAGGLVGVFWASTETPQRCSQTAKKHFGSRNEVSTSTAVATEARIHLAHPADALKAPKRSQLAVQDVQVSLDSSKRRKKLTSSFGRPPNRAQATIAVQRRLRGTEEQRGTPGGVHRCMGDVRKGELRAKGLVFASTRKPTLSSRLLRSSIVKLRRNTLQVEIRCIDGFEIDAETRSRTLRFEGTTRDGLDTEGWVTKGGGVLDVESERNAKELECESFATSPTPTETSNDNPGDVKEATARILNVIACNRYFAHYRQEQARLSRDSSILKSEDSNSPPLVNVLNCGHLIALPSDAGPTTSRCAPRRTHTRNDKPPSLQPFSERARPGYMKDARLFLDRLNTIFTDNYVYAADWKKSVKQSLKKWQLAFFQSITLLALHIFAFFLPVSQSMAMASAGALDLSIVASAILINQNQDMEESTANEGHAYLSKHHRRFQQLALAFALPLSLWGLFLMSAQVTTFPSFAQRSSSSPDALRFLFGSHSRLSSPSLVNVLGRKHPIAKSFEHNLSCFDCVSPDSHRPREQLGVDTRR
ncbi:hypothetical protein NMY22_g5235 [Coprinellus aureogranulatus]|nr:hypothetical protein NMY22_g5235 [Coprinellus aureogranulatus]